MTTLNSDQLAQLLRDLEALDERRRYRKIEFFEPYDKQQEFFAMGSGKRERLLMAANQVGKTEAGAAETAFHLTGDYPWWWTGRRWTRPTILWAAGETSVTVRDTQQKKLVGEPGVKEAFGTGYIPRHLIVDVSTARGIPDALDTVQVRHVSGGVSILRFKSYEQGREKFQSATLDGIWWDEEPPPKIYSEGLTRITATGGMEWMTFTPLKGMSEVVLRFLNEPSNDRGVVTMTIDDAKHIPVEERQRIIDGYPAHEREARARGVPMLGSGRVFPYTEASITEDELEEIPLYWAKLWGIDFGIGHPFAAVLIAWDKDNDVIHILHAIKMKDATPLQHAVPMKITAANVPVAWPQDGTAREKSGAIVAHLYKDQGLAMLPDHATHVDGSTSTEGGIAEMDNRFQTGRLKVASHLHEWFSEYRMYHREDGQIVKLNDDIMSATRIAVMMRRKAKTVPLGGGKRRRPSSTYIADGADSDGGY